MEQHTIRPEHIELLASHAHATISECQATPAEAVDWAAENTLEDAKHDLHATDNEDYQEACSELIAVCESVSDQTFHEGLEHARAAVLALVAEKFEAETFMRNAEFNAEAARTAAREVDHLSHLETSAALEGDMDAAAEYAEAAAYAAQRDY